MPDMTNVMTDMKTVKATALATPAATPAKASRSVAAALLILTLGLAACGSGAALPPAPADGTLREHQAQAFVAAMKPRSSTGGRQPVAVIVALNDGTETTDLLLPHAVLERSGVLDVRVVAPRRGAVKLFPALEVQAEQDFASFDREHPAGADYVIVPALGVEDDPQILGWLRQQHERGAKIIGVCRGTLVLGQAGLLDGRRFAGHWTDRERIASRHPGAVHEPHQRYLVDRGIATTTGITASVPTMLALVEAVGGRAKAQAVADELGVADWSPAHDSTGFVFTGARRWNYVTNKLAFWRDEDWAVDVKDGMDDATLAFAVDAWERTWHVDVKAASAAGGPVTLRSGLVLSAQGLVDGLARVPLTEGLKPVQQLDRTLCEIARRHGDGRVEWVQLEMEYPASGTRCTG